MCLDDNKDLKEQLRKCQEYTKELCEKVNNYSNQLGLGNKVYLEDWIEPIEKLKEIIQKEL